MRLKKLLILGGGHSDIPLIKSAKKLGYYVISSGNKENDLGHKYSDEYRKGDFSNKEEMLQLAQELDVDAICPCANDFAALTCSYISEKLGIGNFDSYEISKIIHHKDIYRRFAQKNNILSPVAKSFSNEKDAVKALKDFTLPIIIKPVDLSGGKGVSKVNHINIKIVDSLIQDAFKASKVKRIVIEDFIEGTNHGLSTLIKNGKVVFHFCDNEHYYLNDYLVSGASAPSMVPNSVINKLIKESEKMASVLNLKDGIFHIQFILQDKQPYIIEICRRPPGDLYIEFVRYATGINYPEYILKSFLGLDISDLKQVDCHGYFTRHCIMGNKIGSINNILIDESIKSNIIDKFMWWSQGDVIKDFKIYKAGIVFLQYSSQFEMDGKINNLNNLIKIEVI